MAVSAEARSGPTGNRTGIGIFPLKSKNRRKPLCPKAWRRSGGERGGAQNDAERRQREAKVATVASSSPSASLRTLTAVSSLERLEEHRPKYSALIRDRLAKWKGSDITTMILNEQGVEAMRTVAEAVS